MRLARELPVRRRRDRSDWCADRKQCLYCTDCQLGSRQIEDLPNAGSVRDADGGTAYILFRKDRFKCSRGADLLKGYKLKDISPTNRVVATCCNSAMFMNSTKVLIGFQHTGRGSGEPSRSADADLYQVQAGARRASNRCAELPRLSCGVDLQAARITGGDVDRLIPRTSLMMRFAPPPGTRVRTGSSRHGCCALHC